MSGTIIAGIILCVFGISLVFIAFGLEWLEKREEKRVRKHMKSAEIFVFPTEPVRKMKNDR